MIYAREWVERHLDYATNGAAGRPESDPVYREVSENRDTPGARPGEPGYYSSCGDLAHWLYATLGVRSSWVNRAKWPDGSPAHYQVGGNVARLAWGNGVVREPRIGERYSVGDVLIVWDHPDTRDAHVIVVYDDSSDVDAVISSEYGQPGGAKRVSTIARVTHRIRGRTIRRVLSLSDVLDAAEREGRLVSNSGTERP